ncbi:hypothetical protein [Haliea sp.]|uniref:hypothetical protein n=1 Tax=Haliea sp. TaxID=1932666 RepID=UPI00257A014D|nr:hypothetical protein [Haliea sp.]
MIEVYLNKRAMGNSPKRVYSLRQKRKVIGSSKWVLLKNVSFVVRAGGRADTLRRLQSGAKTTKTVHAFLKGDVVARGTHAINKAREIAFPREATYNPVFNDSFVDRKTGERLVNAKYAFCSRDTIMCI